MTSYRPAAFYHRSRIRKARTLEKCREAGLGAVKELEELKAWVRACGLVPPKVISTEEARDIMRHPATEWQRELVREAGEACTQDRPEPSGT